MKRKVTEEKTRNFHLCLISEGRFVGDVCPGGKNGGSTSSEISNKLIFVKKCSEGRKGSGVKKVGIEGSWKPARTR